MKRFFCLIVCVFIFLNSFAQTRDRNDNRPANGNRIHAIKVAYVTDRLNLTSDQSARFWPVYSTYETDLRNLRKSYFQKYKGADKSDGQVSRQFFDDNLDFQAAAVDLKRKYRDQFLNIISPQQLASLFKAEHDFNVLLMERLKEKQGSGGSGMWKDNDDK
jgi:hypothetical protein